ncbi:MAG TPA: DUF2703 domain-containing protein [Actinobacteria bacterium]|nr:DUF2703 domain-containing protein [Actinomycetota bacterium]
MQIQFLYFDGCPAWQGGLENLKQALKQSNLSEDFETVKIETDDEAKKHHFIGSPTIRVDGEDIDPAAQGQTISRKGCRIYKTPEGIKGEPTVRMITEVIKKKL